MRRIIEQTHARNDRSLVLLAFDWAKAFDNLSPDGLLECLERFGVPEKFRNTDAAIYQDRQFFIRHAGYESE